MEGTVKWFNVEKGFGFITYDSGSDVFAHFSQIEGDGYKSLIEGDQVSFEIQRNDRGDYAVGIVKL